MKNAFMLMFAALAAAALNAATINQVIVRQQWPWSTKVKVEYSLSGVDASHPVDIAVTTYNGNELLPSTHLREAIEGDLYGITEEFGEFYIDPVVAYGTERIGMTKFKVKLAVTDSAANMSEVLYKIYDLEGGGCDNVTRADLLNGKYGSVETDYTAFTGFNTPVSDVIIWTGVTNNDEYATTKLVMRKIPAAGQTFSMGSPSSEIGRADSEKVMAGGTVSGIKMTGGTVAATSGFETQHDVTMTHDFYIGVFEVTQYQWWKIMNAWPSVFSLSECRNTRPVETVTYENIRGALDSTHEWPSNTSHEVVNTSFLGKLRAALDGAPKIDLPTEAQWEYACRAKSTTAWYSGSNPAYDTGTYNPAGLNKIARFNMNGGCLENGTINPSVAVCATLGTTNGTARVGSYLPNAWGVYDMLGNVIEWCLDYWAPFAVAADSEPAGPTRDKASFSEFGYLNRAMRGSGYWTKASNTRAAQRGHYTHSQTERIRGFRLCLTVEE